MSPATASSPIRPTPTISPRVGDHAIDRVIEIDAKEPVRRDGPRPALTTARLEELARVIRLR